MWATQRCSGALSAVSYTPLATSLTPEAPKVKQPFLSSLLNPSHPIPINRAFQSKDIPQIPLHSLLETAHATLPYLLSCTKKSTKHAALAPNFPTPPASAPQPPYPLYKTLFSFLFLFLFSLLSPSTMPRSPTPHSPPQQEPAREVPTSLSPSPSPPPPPKRPLRPRSRKLVIPSE